MAQGAGPSSKEVTWEDQQQINAFSRLNAAYHELEAELAGCRKQLEDLEDASNEVMLLDDDDDVRYQVGECFFYMSHERVEQKLEQATEDMQLQRDSCSNQIAEKQSEMTSLKGKLYARFGNSINLEEEE